MYPVPVLEVLQKYDFALIDTSFFEGVGKVKTFKDPDSTFELELIKRELKIYADHWSWLNQYVMDQPTVYITPAVSDELKYFHEFLKKRAQICSGRAKNLPSRRLSSERTAKRESWKNELDLDQEHRRRNHPKPLSGLAQLERMIHLVGKAIKKTQVYSPEGFTFETPSLDISPADYELISAGISYLSVCPGNKVGIFTRDYHHIQIYRDYLEPCSFGPGTITVLRFHQGPIRDGKLNLRQKVSGYYLLDQKLEEAETRKVGGIEGKL